jgi:hypothetical protein
MSERREGGRTFVTVPANIENFSGNLLMISILTIFEMKGWIPVLSTKDVVPAVFETNDGAFFAGFVSQALSSETGPMVSSPSKYSKGQKAHQTYSVESRYSQSSHLRIGGMKKVISNLNSMKGFTKEWWSLRSTVIALFKSLPASRVTHLETFMRSREDINKNIKTTFKYQNGGLLRSEEIAYLRNRYSAQHASYEAFQGSLSNPTRDLAENFDASYRVVKSAIDGANEECRLLLANRSRIAFPASKKKEDVKFSAKSLAEKLSIIPESNLEYWFPESLPGITGSITEQELARGSVQFIQARYGTQLDVPLAREIIESWYVLLSNL